MNDINQKAWNFVRSVVLGDAIPFETRTEGLDLLLDQARKETRAIRVFNLDFCDYSIPTAVVAEIKGMVSGATGGQLIPAIKHLRLRTNLGLREAKFITEMIRDGIETLDTRKL